MPVLVKTGGKENPASSRLLLWFRVLKRAPRETTTVQKKQEETALHGLESRQGRSKRVSDEVVVKRGQASCKEECRSTAKKKGENGEKEEKGEMQKARERNKIEHLGTRRTYSGK